jgi:hypothetical protein
VLAALAIPSSAAPVPLVIGDVAVVAGLAGVVRLANVAIYLVLILCAYRAYALRAYRNDFDPEALFEKYLHELEDYTKSRVMANMRDAYAHNERIIKSKVRWLGLAFVALVLETLAVATVVLATFRPYSNPQKGGASRQ